MRKKLLLLIFLVLPGFLNAQIRFQHRFGGVSYDDAQDIIQTADDGFITCGTTETYGAGLSDILVVKTNDSGVVQWSKAYGSPGAEFGVGIKKDPSGGYILVGNTFGLSADTLTDDFLLIKINNNGTVLWAKTYGGPENDEAHALDVMPDSGFVIAGTTSSYGNVSAQAGYVVRTDKNGNLLWSKAITQNSDQQLFAVDATDDGGCVVAGYTYVSGLRLFDIFMAKMNSNGGKQWVKRYGGSSFEQALSVQQASTGGFVVGGFTSSFGTGQEDVFVMRTDDAGNKVSFFTYGTSESERARSIHWSYSNEVVIAGNIKVIGPFGLIDNNLLIKTDTNGLVNWSKTFGPSQNISYAYSTTICSDGGFAMAGVTGGFGAQLNDLYLVRTNYLGGSGCNQSNLQLFSSSYAPTDSTGGVFSNGGVEATVTPIKTNVSIDTYIICNSTGVGVEEMEISERPVIFPNPSTGLVSLMFREPLHAGASITIHNVKGQLLKVIQADSYARNLTIELNGIPDGFYILGIPGAAGSSFQKLIIQH